MASLQYWKSAIQEFIHNVFGKNVKEQQTLVPGYSELKVLLHVFILLVQLTFGISRDANKSREILLTTVHVWNVYKLRVLTCTGICRPTREIEFSELKMHQAKLFNLSQVNQIDVLFHVTLGEILLQSSFLGLRIQNGCLISP